MKSLRLLIQSLFVLLLNSPNMVSSQVQGVSPLASSKAAQATQAQPQSKPQPMTLMPYEQGDWKTLLQTRGTQPMVVHFWGVTCGPCLTEMGQWGQFVSQEVGPVVFVQVDDVSKEITSNLAKRMHIDKSPNYFLRSKFDEFLRYEIDPKWTGEIPYTITIDKNGMQKAYSGHTKFKTLQAWFKKNS